MCCLTFRGWASCSYCFDIQVDFSYVSSSISVHPQVWYRYVDDDHFPSNLCFFNFHDDCKYANGIDFTRQTVGLVLVAQQIPFRFAYYLIRTQLLAFLVARTLWWK